MLPVFAHSIDQCFEREGIPLLLAGGWAVCHHGYSRVTLDTDWVCPRCREIEATALMNQLGFEKTTSGMASRFVRRDQPGFPYIDLFWVDDATIGKMMEPGQTTGLRGEIPVISFRALLAMKLHALKDGAARDHKDLLDLRMLPRYSPKNIAESELRILCERSAGPNAYRQLRDLP